MEHVLAVLQDKPTFRVVFGLVLLLVFLFWIRSRKQPKKTYQLDHSTASELPKNLKPYTAANLSYGRIYWLHNPSSGHPQQFILLYKAGNQAGDWFQIGLLSQYWSGLTRRPRFAFMGWSIQLSPYTLLTPNSLANHIGGSAGNDLYLKSLEHSCN